jgi:hypothetical protein
MTEADKPKNALIAGSVLLICVTVALVVVGVYQYFLGVIREEVNRKVEAPIDERLLALRAEEESKLSRYQWVDRNKGVVRVPLERAKALLIAERAAPPPAPPAPAAAPAGAPGAAPAAPAAPAGAGQK